MCSSRKYPYSPNGRSLEIPRGKGCKTKTLCGVGVYGYFLEQHNRVSDFFSVLALKGMMSVQEVITQKLTEEFKVRIQVILVNSKLLLSWI